jgi:hypothetical protein
MLPVVVIVCGIVAAALAARAVHRSRRGHPLAGLVHGFFAGVVLVLAAGAALVGVNLQGYTRLTNETPAAEVRFRQQGERRFAAEVLYPDHSREAFDLAGDEWQLDARVLKWHAPVTMLGLDTAFRLDRIGGRYRDVASERSQPRTVYELARPPGMDVWSVVRRFHAWLPWVDALYGSATYLPMADGAHFAVSVSPTGLVGRPLNLAAREAVSTWH